jgi:prepilin signal peptidase PulO-like enzyme (type II secretory pathway)
MSHPGYILLWLFVLGTIVGSFLNVVVYRLPRGINLAFPGSHCPSCKQPIRWYDNVPVLGWLWLRGKCRDCGTKISGRYPLVEAATGLLFLTMAFTDVLVPFYSEVQKVALKDGIAVADVELSAISTAEFFATYVYHLALLCTLFVAALIDIDGQRVPRRLITWPAGAGILWAAYWPRVQALPLLDMQSDVTWRQVLIVLATSMVGMIAAVMLRIGIFRSLGAARPREMGLWNSSLALYAVGAFLGWLAAIVIGSAAIVWAVVTQPPQPSAPIWQRGLARFKPMVVVFEWTFFWCLVERPLADWIHAHFW